MDALAYLFLSLTALIIILSINSTVKRLDRKLKRIDMSLSLILNRMEIEFPSRLSERVKQMALDPDRKIEAIKLYREGVIKSEMGTINEDRMYDRQQF
jgi:hypothetical protein